MALTHIDPWFLAQIEDIVRQEQALDGPRCWTSWTRDALLQAQAQRLLRPAPGQAARVSASKQVRERRWALGVRPVYKRVDTCAAEFDTRTAYMYSTYEEECEARPTGPRQDHGAGRRAQPHRPGHRVRLLLRARGARAARGRLRDHHGQLQPGDRVHRLRHLGPPVLRAADPGGRARDRGGGEAQGRDRPVRRPDAAQARARPRSQRRADHRHLSRHDRLRGGPRALPAAAATSSGSSSRPTAPRATPTRRSRWRRRSAIRWWCGRATCWAGAPWRSCTSSPTSSATCARR